jgi:PncC family amidohydrolase
MQECDLLFHAETTAETLINKLKARRITVALAESCTAGLVSNLLARVPGASNVLWGSFVCYTKEAKISMLGLDGGELDAHGLVSAETARAMAEKALEKGRAQVAASVTGLAGPGGDGSDTPVGTVYVAAAARNRETSVKGFNFKGGRNEVRIRAAIAVLEAINALT